MDGLKPGRIVYYVFDDQAAADITRWRAAFIPQVPSEDQRRAAGNAVHPGDIAPAMVVRVFDRSVVNGDDGMINLKVMLDGPDEYWATGILYDEGKKPGTWHWMFEGQSTRYQPDRVEAKA